MHRTTAEHQGWSIEGVERVAQTGGLRARQPRKGAFGVIEVSRACGTIIPLRERTNVPTYVRRRQDIFIGYDLIFRRSASSVVVKARA